MNTDRDWIENLITAVQDRPALYNKSLGNYSDRDEKAKLWEEICEIMIPEWNDLAQHEKIMKGM